MNTEAQRIAIAKACGWTLKHCNHHGCNTWHSPEGICADGDDCSVLPNYLSDLNAMHESEKMLEANQLWLMTDLLTKAVPAETPIAHATAAQRAKAFLKTIGKWTTP